MLNKIKSNYIMNLIFKNMKNKKKLNLIKYNKIMTNRLNLNEDDFKIYQNLKEFNKIYNKDFDDIDIKEFNISLVNFNIGGLKFLNTLPFKGLEKLNLSSKGFLVINELEKVNFRELKELNLSYNKISDITILEKVNFMKLRKLSLNWNNISDINILEKVYFKELK